MNKGPGAINRIYRLVWRDAIGAYVAVAEFARGHGKRSSAVVGAVLAIAAIAATSALAAGPPATNALPTGAAVSAGQASISQSGNQLTILQSSTQAAINWQSFNIGAQAQVNFSQPSAASVALNRVMTGDPSAIYGRMSANGQVILVNPSGIVFGPGSQVDVGGLVASSLNISDTDFMNGRLKFFRESAGASVVNQGALTAKAGGYIALLSQEARNEGVLTAKLGTVAMAAGDAVTLDISGTGLLGVKVDPASVSALVENRNLIQVDGGTAILSAGAANRLVEQAISVGGASTANQLVTQDGVLRLVSSAAKIEAAGGAVLLEGSTVDTAGIVNVSASKAGSISVRADFINQSGQMQANSDQGQGGHIALDATTVMQTASTLLSADGATAGGSVSIQGGHTGSTDSAVQGRIYSSANLSARGTGANAEGGSVSMTADSVQLRAVRIDASGTGNGGSIRIGGGFQGADSSLANALELGINASSSLRADAGERGDGGTVVVWSDNTTLFAGQVSATGGALGGNGGQAEISGKGNLAFTGKVDLSGAHGGSVLFDPRNIIIDDASSALATLDLADPTPSSTNGFGTTTKVLSGGNVLITAPNADTGSATATGAVYLFDTKTGALLSNLRGSYAGDKISSAGIYTLSNGNYLVLSPNFYTQASKNYFSKSALDATVMTDALPHPSAYAITAGSVSSGAITWQSGAGTNGGAANLVGTSNSLVGSTGTDSVSTYNGKNVSTGSATVTANDQLGKLTYFDAVNYVSVPGTTAVYALTDGNVVVGNPYAYNGRGSATWINASNGQLRNGAAGGAISATVSLVGSTPIRSVAVTSTDSSSHTVYVLDWASALPYTETYNGSANSPIRSNAPGAPGDFVGQSVVALAGGNYAVASPQWTNGAYTYAGAVTYGASGGATGTVATSNSLYGDRSFDFVGSGGIVPVGTGGANYLVDSPLWAATGNAAAGKFLQNNPNGAVTWVNGSNGLVYGAGATGVAVAIGNSLVGAAGDALGSKASSSSLTSYSYDYNTTTYNTTYPYAASRMTQGDVANGLVTLTNGNYLVVDTTSGGSAGSVTFGLGATGMAGQMSSANSLVGSTGGDLIGTTVIPLSASNYVAYSPTWTHPTGTKINAGAVTWGSASSGVLGAVSSANSLVGSDAYEAVGSGGVITVGAMGSDGLRPHYLVLSPQWGNRASVQYTTAAFGAVTWVDGSNGHAFGAAGAGAALSSSNSLVGSLAGDYVGSYNQSNSRMTTSMGNDGASRIDSTWYANLTPTVDLLTNGNFVVRSPSWSAGKGAVTWGNGTTGLAGAVGSSNSLVGSTSDVYTTATSSRTANAQAYTDTTYNLTTTGDHVGLLGSTLNDGNFLTISPSWGNGRGALTWLGASSVGTVGTANSLLGSTQDIFSATNHNQLVSAGDRLGTLADSTWVTPTVSVRNSDGYTTTATRNLGPYQFGISSDVSAYTGSVYIKVGQNYGTQSVAVTHFVSDGYGGLSTNFAFNSSPIVSQLSNGNVLIGSASWNNTAATAAGAVTWLNGANGHYADGSSGGTLSGANSLLASHTNDNLGYALPVGGVVELSNGNYVLVNPQWNSERGAVTWGSGTAGVVGTVSSANSLVGNTASGSIAVTVGYHPTTGYTAYRYVQGLGWVGAWVDKNSDLKGDQIGRGGVFALADGNFVVSSPFWSTDPTAAATTVLPASYGAATWVNGTNGQLIGASSGGLVSASNSLVGSQYGDAVSYAVWDLYGPQSLGSTPASAPLSISSTPAYSYIMPGVAVLAGGRYAVASPYWANGSAAQAGAVTFVAAGGAVGAVGTSNSLTGSTANDHVGRGQATDVYDAMIGWYIHTWTPGVITLSNASYTNYVVRSADWTNTNDVATGGAAAGAMTWVDGSNGHAYGDSSTAATVNQANSLVGNLAGNAVGQTNISLQRTVGNAQVATGDLLSLSNAAYCAAGAGSITLIPGATGIAGPISWRNSVVGLASSSAGLQTTTWDSYSNYLSDVQYAMLPTAVTASEQVQYRPLVWVTPDATSGANATHAMALTVVGQSTTTPNTADLVNTAGNLNWTSDKLAATSAEFTALGGSAGLMAFSASTGGDVVMTPAALTDMLNAGTNVTLQASNNITVLKAVTSSAAGTGGSLTLEAGRSVTIQANITTDNGNFSATTNKGVASGVVDADCSVCVAQIVMAPGTSINAGTGDVNLTVLKSTDKTSNAAANMVLDDLYGAHIAVVNQGLDSSNQGVGIRFNAATVIGTSATQSVVLKAGGSSATGAGIVLASDTLIRGANAAQLQVAAADTAGVVGFDAAGAGFSMTAAEVGSVIQQSSGFANISLGRSDQSGATALTGMNFTAAAMLRGASTLPVNVSVLAGSGGLGITGTLTSGEASANQFELSVTNGVLALGTSSVAASTGVFKLSALGSGSVTKGAGTFNISQLLLNGTGAFGLTAGTNTIGTLAGNVGSAQVKTSASSLTVGSVGGLDGITAATGLLLQAAGASSDVVLNQAVGSAAGDSVLIAARNFTNNLASDTGILPGTGRYLVYSTNPANSLEGMGTYSKHYAQSYTGTMPAYASSGNWFLYSLAPTLSASVSGGSTITYGASGSTPSVNITGYIDGDTFASATAGSLNTSLGAYTPSNAGYIPVGSYTISLTGVGTLTSPLGYQVSATTGSSTLAVQAKALAVTGLSANGKVYDGTVSTTVTGTAALAGAGATSSDGKFLTSDLVSLSGTATGSFADKNYGLGKSVTLSGLSLSGADAANYVISSNSVTADITRKTLTVSGLSTVASKVYDGNTNAAVSGTAALLAGETAGSGNSSDGRFYTGDTVSLTGTATGSYNSKDVASATTVTLTGMTLSGAAANNYTLGSQAATITPKSVSASGISASNREYDAGVSVGLTGSAGLTGGGLVAGDGKYINGDSISVNGTANGSFASAGVANGKTVTLTGLSLGGSDSGNYALNAYTTTANVTARQLVISADNQSKVYGDTDPSLTYTIGGSGLANGEQASSVLSGAISTAAGSSATAGTHAITQGNLASHSNYSIATFNSGNLTVSKATLNVTADDKAKVYGDSDPALSYTVNAAQLKYTDTGSVANGVSLSADTGAAATAGNHVITASGGTAANYSISAVNGKLSVSKASLSVTADDKAKVYGDTDPTLSYTVNAAQLKYTDSGSVVNGVSLSADTGAAATAGSHAITVSGGAAANYSISAVNGKLSVSKATLNVTADDKRKNVGEPDPAFTYQVNAAQLRYADTTAVVSGVIAKPLTGGSLIPADYPIVATSGLSANYVLSYVDGIFKVKATPSVNAEGLSVSSGQSVGAPSAPATAAVATGNAQPGQLSVVGGGISVPASSLGTGTGTSTSTSTSTSASTSTSTVSGATPDSGTSTGSTSTGASSSGGERSAGTGAANNAPLATAVQQTFAAVISAGSSITVQTVKAFQIPAGETVRYFATQQNQEPMPSWLVIDPTSGVMSGTPPKGGPETITVTVTATDEAGRKATATFTLTGTPG